MAWVKVDDAYADHPKHQQVGPLGQALWLAGLGYCNRNLTDGFIPWAKARSLLTWDFLGPPDDDGRQKVYTISVTCGMAGEDVTSQFVIDLLLSAGLWEERDGGYYVHDYPSYQPSKQDVLQQRAAAAQRQAKYRDSHPGNAVSNNVSNAVTVGVTDGSVTPAPDPESRIPNPVPLLAAVAGGTTHPIIRSATDEDVANADDAWEVEKATDFWRKKGKTPEQITAVIRLARTKAANTGQPIRNLTGFVGPFFEEAEREAATAKEGPPRNGSAMHPDYSDTFAAVRAQKAREAKR